MSSTKQKLKNRIHYQFQTQIKPFLKQNKYSQDLVVGLGSGGVAEIYGGVLDYILTGKPFLKTVGSIPFGIHSSITSAIVHANIQRLSKTYDPVLSKWGRYPEVIPKSEIALVSVLIPMGFMIPWKFFFNSKNSDDDDNDNENYDEEELAARDKTRYSEIKSGFGGLFSSENYQFLKPLIHYPIYYGSMPYFVDKLGTLNSWKSSHQQQQMVTFQSGFLSGASAGLLSTTVELILKSTNKKERVKFTQILPTLFASSLQSGIRGGVRNLAVKKIATLLRAKL
ncbi:hypothetical protein M0813_13866 [Anaeramoeba flamelloides]|uniref:Uncharacterized protein n=1 Tax=Anaeramoeba flamelloides TaxID=1746091 RepID=A0ABQ8Z7E6_9EUKA|nr:hypothetical protein M0813_13866 [Anaeramoeba flamelloides]